MTDQLTIALAQLNPTVGDIDGNAGLVREARRQAAAMGADLLVTGELVMAGYPPEDLVLKGAFQRRVEADVQELARETADGGPALLIGAPWRHEERLYNAALLLDGGRIAALSFKHDLPNYGVFDEMRLFTPGPLPEPMEVRGVRLGVLICEDMWTPAVAGHLKQAGAELLLVLNGSPFEMGKVETRQVLARDRVRAAHLPLAYVNLVGGQDELVFDGASFVMGNDGDLRLRLPSWEDGVVATHWARQPDGHWDCSEGTVAAQTDRLETIYGALVRGLHDYVDKNGFKGVLIGLSGGIDSALSAAVAVDALGPDRVRCVMMPSKYTSQESLDDAAEAARLLGVRLDSISIAPAVDAFDAMTADVFAGCEPDTTEENIQARTRGIALMAMSNKFGLMVLSTGNKSEMSVGYATLYGDMCGGYSVLKDIYKTTVFALSRWRNGHRPRGGQGPDGPAIPETIIAKPPTAELKPDQCDQDTLPPYEELDDILECLIEGEMAQAEIAERGHDPAVVRQVWRMVDRAEYKRRQAPPGVKIGSRSFGRDRRYPITNKFQG